MGESVMQKTKNNWYDIKMKNGDVFEINEETYKNVKKILSAPRNERPDFIFISEEETIRVDYIASIILEKN
jgi:hypothetical protein